MGLRTYYSGILCDHLRHCRWLRNEITKVLEEVSAYETVVHLRGTDRVTTDAALASYVDNVVSQLNAEEVLIVSDSQTMVAALQERVPRAVLRTPL